jgi:hypothetical protein
VAESAHEFSQGGAALSGHYSAGVAEVVESEIRPACSDSGFVPDLVESAASQLGSAHGAREQQTVFTPCGVIVEVLSEDGSRCGGIATLRIPAADFGGPTWGLPSTQVTPRETRITPF